MHLAHPYADLFPGARGAVLAELVRLRRPVSVRQLALAADVSHQHASKLVSDLKDAGVVVADRVGGARLISLNRRHLAVHALTELVGLRWALVERLRDELRGWPNLAGAWLFGSAARGDGDRYSDIDILLVAETTVDDEQWDTATARLVQLVPAWTGNSVQLVEHTRESLAELVRSDNPLIRSIRQEGIPLTEFTSTLTSGSHT